MSIDRTIYNSVDMRANLCEIGRLGLPHKDVAEIQEKAKGVACLININACLDQNTYRLKAVDSFHEWVKKEVQVHRKWQGSKGECNGLDDTVKFREEPACGFGTAFLVGKQLAVTAAHCLLNRYKTSFRDDLSYCRLIFDFHMLGCTNNNCTGNNQWNEDFDKKTYSFTVLSYKYSRVESDKWEDWAILKLDKEVTNRTPLTVKFSHQLSQYDPIYMLGHPFGLPLKFASNAAVTKNSNPKYFLANIDACRGNSGSPVFLLKTHDVVGILFSSLIEDLDNHNGTLTMHHVTPEELANGDNYEKCYKITSLTFLEASLSSIDIPHAPQLDATQPGLNVAVTCTSCSDGIMSLKFGFFHMHEVCASMKCPRAKCNKPIDFSTIDIIILKECTYSLNGMNANRKWIREDNLTVGPGQHYQLNMSHWKFIKLNINPLK